MSTRPGTLEGAARGMGIIVATGFVMAFGDALVKAVSADFSLAQIYVLRSLFAVPVLVGLLLWRVGRVPGRPTRWIVLRSLLLLCMWLAFYGALPVLSLATVAAAYYTAPLFIVLFSALLLGERVGAARWAGVAAGFVGVVLVVRPGTEAFTWLALLPVLAAVFYALAAIVTRARCTGDHPLSLSLALNLGFLAVGVVGSLGIALGGPAVEKGAIGFLLGPWAPLDGRAWAVLALMAVVIVAVSTGVAKAYQVGSPSLIAIFDYSYLPFAAFWGYALFGDVPDGRTGAGMLLIAGAGLLVVLRPVRGPMRRTLA